jgi:hypothetical protein
MMKSEQDRVTLIDAFLNENKEIKKQIKEQNYVIKIILGCLVIGGIILFCILII